MRVTGQCGHHAGIVTKHVRDQCREHYFRQFRQILGGKMVILLTKNIREGINII
jgi:hypothetical protein